MAERIGCQEPTLHVAEPYAVTMGTFMAEWERTMKGVTLNPWQLPILSDWLALGPGLRYVHPRNLLEVPRQNGKTELALARIDWGVAVLPLVRKKAGLSFQGERILYSAHDYSTVVEIFGRMQEYYGTKANDPKCEYPHLNRMVRSVRKAIAKEAIFFKKEYGGGCVYFSTRTNSSKLGFTVDAIMGDEAQELTEVQQTAFVSTSSSAPLKNSQFIYLGTPPVPSSRGDVFQSMRDDVAEGADTGEHGAISLSEWSVNDLVPEGFGDHLDEDMWWRLNPAMGLNLQPGAPNVELGMYRQPLSFAQQRLGYWLPRSKAENLAIRREDWSACRTEPSRALGPGAGRVGVGVKFSPDGAQVAWSVAVTPSEGPTYVELIGSEGTEAGIGAVTSWIIEHRQQVGLVVVDGQSGAAELVEELGDAGMRKTGKIATTPVWRSSTSDYIDACSVFMGAVRSRDVAHLGQEALDDSATRSRRRKVGTSGTGFDNGQESACAPVESCALATWASRKTARDPSRVQRVRV